MESSGAVGGNGNSQHVIVPLRAGGKKMRKRRDLDALLTSKRRPRERPLLVPSTDDQDEQDVHDGSGVKTRSKRKWWLCGGTTNGATCRLWTRTCKSVLACACLVAACAALWLFADVRMQLASLRQQVELVSAGSKGVPEALQQCHETTRTLAANQSLLTGKADTLTEQLANLTTQLLAVQTELDSLRSRLKSSPELLKVPQQLNDLSNSVAQFGSQIKDLEATVGGLKEQGTRLQTAADTLRNNVTVIQSQLSNQTLAAAASEHLRPAMREDAAEREQLLHDIEITKQQLATANSTLSNQLQWASEEQKSNKVKLDKLLENSVKVESQIATIQGSQTTNNKKLENLEYAVGNLTKELNETNNSTKRMVSQTMQLQSQINSLANDSQNTSRKSEQNDTVLATYPQSSLSSTQSPSALAASAIFGPNKTDQVAQNNNTNDTPSISSSIAPILSNGQQPGKPSVLSAIKEQ